MGKVKKPVRGRVTKNVAEIARHFKSSKTPSGTIALFAGPSGSGKSKAAQTLAAETGLDVYRIDLAAVVNKYIGETEKNLARVLETAETRDVILLFDEADALFGQRTEVRNAPDRYANIDANYLLQRIEQYSGLVILTTNNKKKLDPALLRRVRFVIEFPLSQ
jgi:SpoVK/Ycf46/Vps4 family AAA+-type ATPase